jgi:Tfp pilus assembly protein PilE
MIKLQTTNHRLRKSLGLTLIEILVVFTVASILAGIGIASFVTYSRSQQINQSASNIKLLVNEAKFNSLSVVKSATNEQGQEISCGAQSLVGYRIDVVSQSQITLTQVCDEVTPPNRTLKTLTLPDNVVVTSALPSQDCLQILFSSLTSAASGVPCSIEISGFGQAKTVEVDTAGNASVN